MIYTHVYAITRTNTIHTITVHIRTTEGSACTLACVAIHEFTSNLYCGKIGLNGFEENSVLLARVSHLEEDGYYGHSTMLVEI